MVSNVFIKKTVEPHKEIVFMLKSQHGVEPGQYKLLRLFTVEEGSTAEIAMAQAMEDNPNAIFTKGEVSAYDYLKDSEGTPDAFTNQQNKFCQWECIALVEQGSLF